MLVPMTNKSCANSLRRMPKMKLKNLKLFETSSMKMVMEEVGLSNVSETMI